jgi:phosphoribosylformylglycinamidine cyclo-ligase
VAAGSGAYRRAGVDLDAAARAVDLIRDVARGAARPEVVEGIGGFAGLFRLGDGRLLAAATDGVGTKVEVARAAGRLDTIGIDLVAMSANDVVTTGAEPLFFLDYIVTERLAPEQVADLVSGVAEGCRRAGCALLGGETAEHPGHLGRGRFDMAGFCVGVVGENELLGPHRVREGDVLLGLRSTGLHANGFSLVRRVVEESQLDLGGFVGDLGRPLGEELLEPTAMYGPAVLAAARRGLVHAAAHVTGGGILENLPRVLPEGAGAEVDTHAWRIPPVFDLVGGLGNVSRDEQFRVFNMGVGMVLVTPPGSEDEAVRASREAGIEAVPIGTVDSGSGVRLR